MKISELILRNFRRYESAKFHFHPNFTILIGDNGAGKTTILDAIAIMLATYFQGSGITIRKYAFKKGDKRLIATEKQGQIFLEPQKEVYLSAMGEIHGQPIEWRRYAGDRGGKAKELVNIGCEDRDMVCSNLNPDLPLLLYYGSRRLWDVHRNVTTEKPKSQLDAYRFCLDPMSDQKAFEKWFKKLSLSEIQDGRQSLALKAVKSAVISCIPDAQDFFHDIRNDEAIIKLKNQEIVPFNNLSDGYRNMVAMVADIAHRACRLNPHLGENSAVQSSGVILIDEIDLHLHPKWQRQVVDDLQKAFPNIQFIATTHSPFIIQSASAGEVIDLNLQPLSVDSDNEDNVAAPGTLAEYTNRSIEDIAEEIMGVEIPQRSERYQQMYDAAKEYYSVLQDAKTADDAKKDSLKRKLDELSAPFSDNVAYHAFLEMKRMAAGLGHSENEEA